MTPHKYLIEKSSGLFFGPVSDTVTPTHHQPAFDRARGWLYKEKELTAVIIEYYGGPAGAELITTAEPEKQEFHKWCGRKGGMMSTPKKTKAVRRNATHPRPNAFGKKKPRKVVAP